jgi:oligopeptide transport system substrate-binding protein
MALVAIIALGLAACGDDDEGDGETPTPDGTDAPTATPEPVAGGEITVRITEPEFLDPHIADFSVDITIIQMVTRGLYDLLPGGELRPAYASGPAVVSDDGLVYTVPIRDGLTWADGEVLDANDFVAGIQRTCNPDIAGHYQYILTNIGGCDDYYGGEGLLDGVTVAAPDDLTLEITLAAAQATFPSLLALWPTYPAPESVALTDPWPDPPNTPCNGPFCITSSESGAAGNMVMEPNASWGLEPAPKLDKITLQFIDDASQALRAYDAGDLDMTRIGQQDLPSVRDRDDFVDQPLPITIGLEYYMPDPLLADYNVRLALSRAIDRDLYSEVVFNNGTIPTTNWVPSEEPGANALDAFEDTIGFNADAARTALSDAGYPDGAGFPGVSFIIRDDATELAAAEFLQAQYLDILNIDMEIEQVDSQTRQDRFNSGNFQLILGGWGHDYPDAENWLIGLYNTGASINKQECSDPEIDAALDAAAVETENEPRWALLQEAERLVVEGLCGIAPLYHRGNFYLIDSNLKGVSPTLEDHHLPQFPEDWFLEE